MTPTTKYLKFVLDIKTTQHDEFYHSTNYIDLSRDDLNLKTLADFLNELEQFNTALKSAVMNHHYIVLELVNQSVVWENIQVWRFEGYVNENHKNCIWLEEQLRGEETRQLTKIKYAYNLENFEIEEGVLKDV